MEGKWKITQPNSFILEAGKQRVAWLKKVPGGKVGE